MYQKQTTKFKFIVPDLPIGQVNSEGLPLDYRETQSDVCACDGAVNS